MEIKKRICFSTGRAPDIVNYLKDHSISYTEGEHITVVEILERDPNCSVIVEIAKECKAIVDSKTEFSQEDINNAEWLRMWSSWRCGYPQPENGYIEKAITYAPDKVCPDCGCGLVQIGSFRMKKSPSWRKHNFAELNWIGDELFLSSKAKEVLEKSDISGITFRQVYDRKGITPLENCYQLVVPYILEKGLDESQTNINAINICHRCGSKKYLLSGIGMKAYDRSVFVNAPDIVKTGEIFGDMHYAVRSVFVRKKVYRLLKENCLDYGLVFYPILLVD